MSIKTKAVILVSSAAVLLFMVAGGLDGVRASSNDGAYRQLQVYSEVLSRVRSEYVEEPNIPQVTDGALHGLLESLDANSSYLSPLEYKEYKSHRSEARGEIGAAVSKRFGYAAVVSVIPGGPPDKAGLQATDIIEAIEGKSTREMSLAEVHSLLSGQPGSNVTVSVVRARRAEPQKMVITRDLVTIPPVNDKMVEDGIGYVQVDAFVKGKAQEVAGKVKALQKLGAKKLILDLRNCAEGEESEGIATANLFLNHGTITYLQGQKYPREAFNADPSRAITNLPVAVLVNKGTAGPAEVVAAAVLENARGDVVGDKTFGDGSVQKVIELPDGSALILSIAKYYSPSGKAIQDTAVTPNILVADTDDDVPLSDEDQEIAPPDDGKKQPPQQDEQLHRAIQVLKKRAS
ncbi:MAG: peptidase S41 [Acidobacteria bacterium 13_1_40CM_4_58_4]|nr:MAG: peptidase S41 [Acidobacteria bacterium 13_1_40CM_4_58_4]